MLRREFLVGGVAAWALTAHAQQTAPVRRIGVFLFSKEDRTIINPFIEGLEALGYGIGKDTVIEFRDAGGKSERFAERSSVLHRT